MAGRDLARSNVHEREYSGGAVEEDMVAQVTQPQDIAKLVRATRKRQGLTQVELAGACGTSTRFIIELEKGKPTCQLGRVLHVLSMLGIEVTLKPGSAS